MKGLIDMIRFHARRTVAANDATVGQRIADHAKTAELMEHQGECSGSVVYGNWVSIGNFLNANEYVKRLTELAAKYPGWRFSFEVGDGT